ncbi:hypothetical protein THAOC_20137, partial [Thalassiosira oceanica]
MMFIRPHPTAAFSGLCPGLCPGLGGTGPPAPPGMTLREGCCEGKGSGVCPGTEGNAIARCGLSPDRGGGERSRACRSNDGAESTPHREEHTAPTLSGWGGAHGASALEVSGSNDASLQRI